MVYLSKAISPTIPKDTPKILKIAYENNKKRIYTSQLVIPTYLMLFQVNIFQSSDDIITHHHHIHMIRPLKSMWTTQCGVSNRVNVLHRSALNVQDMKSTALKVLPTLLEPEMGSIFALPLNI